MTENSGYYDKIKRLREKKILQTTEKLTYEGYLDEDDYGRIVPTFEWHIIPNSDDGNFYGISGWSENFCDLMDKHDTYIDEDDAFTGRWMYFMSKMRPYKFDDSLIPKKLQAGIDYYKLDAGIGFDAHFCPDYTMLLDLGWRGLLDKLAKYKKINQVTNPDCGEFYDCHAKVIVAIQGWMQRHIDKLSEMIAKEKNENKTYELSMKKETNEHILFDKPKSLREAMQLILWFHLASRTFNRDGAGGQLDSLLFPYYQHDLQKGLIDRDTAVYLMSCFLINDPVYWQIGGENASKQDNTNEMSFIILDAAELANVSLNITIRVTEHTNERLLNRGVELLVKYKHAWPRFSGDKALVAGFMRLGNSEELARNRIAVGCNWMSLPGREYTLNDLFKVNFAKIFELSWTEMMEICGFPALNGDIGTYHPIVKGTFLKEKKKPSTQLLYQIFLKHLAKAVHILADAMRFHLNIQYKNETELLLNLLSHGPIEKGLDISHGGAQYYNLAIDGAALGTVADCFTALQQRIEEENRLDWRTINSLLRTNWACDDNEYYISMMRSSNHYGDSKKGNTWAKKISQAFSQLVIAENDERRTFIPGLFSWAKPHILGRDVGATPDGRRYGEPITHGANPSTKYMNKPTCLAIGTAIASVQPGYGNTAPFQLEFDPFIKGQDSVKIVESIIKAHFAMGGTLINVNIFDKDVILAAHKNPADYPDLVVRVTGFTAYFCMLTPEFRQQVVDRILQN